MAVARNDYAHSTAKTIRTPTASGSYDKAGTIRINDFGLDNPDPPLTPHPVHSQSEFAPVGTPADSVRRLDVGTDRTDSSPGRSTPYRVRKTGRTMLHHTRKNEMKNVRMNAALELE
jgi:hypothetical protein